MRAWRHAALAVAALATGAAAPKRDGVTMTSAGWLSAPTRWTVHPDGSIDDVRADVPQGFLPPLGTAMHMIVRHVAPRRGRVAVITRLLDPARRLAGQPIRCDGQHTDDSYGHIVWPNGTRLAYSFGCEGPANAPIITSVRAATAQVKRWVADAPVVRRYDLTADAEAYDSTID